MVLLRKFFSAYLRLCRLVSSLATIFSGKWLFERVSIGSDFSCGKGLYLACTDGGTITFGNNVSIGRNVKIIAQGGSITIGDNSYIGDGVVITSKESISVGKDALIAEYVVVRDQDHGLKSDPINKAGFTTAAIFIEQNVWLSAKATVLKGVYIGEGAVVAAHALVNKDVAARAIVAGIPARKVNSR